MYKITEIFFEINGLTLPSCWKQFQSLPGEEEQKADFKVSVLHQEKMAHGMECYSLEHRPVHLWKMDRSILLTDEKWKEGKLFSASDEYGTLQLLLQMFYTHAVARGMIQVHSSLIDYRGKGVLFLGPSGIGKTTQAELWNQYRETRIINGDVVFVQKTRENFLGWGTPWHGSSPYCIHDRVPLRALVVLKQDQKNRIRRLEGFEKVAAVSRSIFYPRWMEEGTALCLDILDQLLTALPVYELSCRPEEEAVALTEKTIFGD